MIIIELLIIELLKDPTCQKKLSKELRTKAFYYLLKFPNYERYFPN